MGQNMGIGALGSEQAVFKRKFRWAFTILQEADNPIVTGSTLGISGTTSSPSSGVHFCKIASRPNFTFDEQEVQHVTEKVFLPAKPTWEPVSITVYDLNKNDAIYLWLNQFYIIEKGRIRPVAEPIGNTFPKKRSQLLLFDGHGNEIERWEFQGCWPQSINWGELDFSDSGTLDVEFNMRYDRAVNRSATVPSD